MSNDTRTFKRGETVIVWDGSRKRSSVELAEVGKDCSYIDAEVLLTFGVFNTVYRKSSVHKLPPTLRTAIKASQTHPEKTIKK